MDMARASIIEGGIDDTFWPEVRLAMTYIKNIRPTTALNGLSPHQKLFNSPPDTTHLRVLGSTIYFLIHEEERELKSEKFVPRAMKGTLVGFDGHTIYRVHIEEQSRVIRAKDLRIFEDTEIKKDTILPHYEKEPTFQGFLLDDNGDEETTSNTKASNEMPSNATKDQSKPKTAEQQRKSRSGRTIKPSERAMGQSLQTQELIAHLTKLLDHDWEDNSLDLDPSTRADAFFINLDSDSTKSEHDAEDPLKILASRLLKANAGDPGEFAFATQIDVEEPETYSRAMSGTHAQQWSQAMKEELDRLEANQTWDLIHKRDIEPGHKPLGGKWVYKVKRDVNGDIARFKARWVVKGYLQQYGVDFDQTFDAVVKPMAFRVLFAIAAYYDLDIDQMDVKTAFLYGLIDQLIYVEKPKGTETNATRDMICKLPNALYGLKQSPRLWYERLSSFLLEKLGLRRINADHSIFITSAGLNGPIVSTFVDDIKIMGIKGSGFIERVKAELTSAFQMADMGPISFYVGLKVKRNREQKTIKLSQPAYIEKILRKSGQLV